MIVLYLKDSHFNIIHQRNSLWICNKTNQTFERKAIDYQKNFKKSLHSLSDKKRKLNLYKQQNNFLCIFPLKMKLTFKIFDFTSVRNCTGKTRSIVQNNNNKKMNSF